MQSFVFVRSGPDCRHLYRCGVGEHVLGQILGLGPKRDLGTHHHARICPAATLAVAAQMARGQTPKSGHPVSYMLNRSISVCAVHLLRRVVSDGRIAFLRIKGEGMKG